MNKSKVSIVIPFYNTDKQMFERCIKSVLDQKYTEFECLIIDDGSKPEFREFLDGYENRDERIRVFHKENGGLGNTRNFGVKQAVGDYMYFLDSDDYISPYTFRIGMDLADENNADMVIGGLIHVEVDEDPGFQSSEKRVELVESEEDKLNLIMHMSGIKQPKYMLEVGATGTSACSRFVKREIALSVQFENDRYWDEDDLWNMSVVKECKKILVTDVCWYAYIINPNSMVRAYAGDRTKEFQVRAKQEYDRMKKLWPGCMQGAYYHVWDGVLRYCRTDAFHALNPKNKTDRFKDFCKAIDMEEFKESIEMIDFNYERRFKYRLVKKTIKRLLLLKNKKLAFKALEACNKRIKF